MVQVTFPLEDKAAIVDAHKRLSNEIRRLNSELKIASSMLKQVYEYCDHAGQQTGYNERDGGWGSPCPTCGYSY